MAEAVPLLDVRDLTVEFSTRRGVVRAVEHVDIRIGKGETTDTAFRRRADLRHLHQRPPQPVAVDLDILHSHPSIAVLGSV